jgi:hypothetical protein
MFKPLLFAVGVAALLMQAEPPRQDLSPMELAGAAQLSQQIATTDWLGPLSAVALSPFFGITCLSGLALWGQEWIPWNTLLSADSPLRSEPLFWSFAALTVLTSLPRLMKVSKPIAQLADRLETYAAIVTLVCIRLTAASAAPEAAGGPMTAGIGGSIIDLVMIVAMGLNLIVVSAVRAFFEFVCWLMPIPLVDAACEGANKTIVAALMGLYAFSPLLATIVNMTLLFLAAIVFRWVYRRVRYLRAMSIDLTLPMVWSGYGVWKNQPLRGFVTDGPRGWPQRSCVTIDTLDDRWQITLARWLAAPRRIELPRGAFRARIKRGLLKHQLSFEGESTFRFAISRRFDKHLDQIAQTIGADLEGESVDFQSQLGKVPIEG